MSRPAALPMRQRSLSRKTACRRSDRDKTEPGYRPGLSLELICPSPPTATPRCGYPHHSHAKPHMRLPAPNYRKARSTEPDDCRKPHPTRQSFGTTRRIRNSGSHLGSTLKPGGAVLTLGVSRRSGSAAYIRVDASPNEVLTPPMMHEELDRVNSGVPVNSLRLR